jgi:hypothetical protein
MPLHLPRPVHIRVGNEYDSCSVRSYFRLPRVQVTPTVIRALLDADRVHVEREDGVQELLSTSNKKGQRASMRVVPLARRSRRGEVWVPRMQGYPKRPSGSHVQGRYIGARYVPTGEQLERSSTSCSKLMGAVSLGRAILMYPCRFHLSSNMSSSKVVCGSDRARRPRCHGRPSASGLPLPPRSRPQDQTGVRLGSRRHRRLHIHRRSRRKRGERSRGQSAAYADDQRFWIDDTSASAVEPMHSSRSATSRAARFPRTVYAAGQSRC